MVIGSDCEVRVGWIERSIACTFYCWLDCSQIFGDQPTFHRICDSNKNKATPNCHHSQSSLLPRVVSAIRSSRSSLAITGPNRSVILLIVVNKSGSWSNPLNATSAVSRLWATSHLNSSVRRSTSREKWTILLLFACKSSNWILPEGFDAVGDCLGERLRKRSLIGQLDDLIVDKTASLPIPSSCGKSNIIGLY